MKVYYISSGLQGCYQVRCLLPLQANGWDGDQTSIRLESRTPEDKMRAANHADVVVFHRPEEKTKLELARILKEKGKKIVYDNDDTAKEHGGFKFNEVLNEERVKRGMDSINDNLDTFIKEADLVTCSTEYLADEYRKLNPNVIVIPNMIDPFLFDDPLRNDGDKVRIGITGSLALTDDLKLIEPIVKYYSNDPRVQFVLFSLPPANHDKTTRDLYKGEYEFWESVNIEWQPFVPMQDYYETLNNLRLDLMIIPRADNYFNRCKSNIKFLEASMFEIPVIASKFPDGKSPYEVNPEDAKHMVLVENATTKWIEAIEAMIDAPKARRKLGEKARKYVLNNYNIDSKAHLWEDAYKTLYDPKIL